MAPEAIEKALTFAEEQNADTVCWNCYHECDDIISKYPPIIPDGGIYQGDEMQKLLTEALYNTHTEHFYPGMMFRAVWGKLLSAEVIRNNAISFPIGLPLGEDAAFLAEYFNYCNKVLLVNRYWNYYKISSASAVGKYKSNLKKIQMKELEIIKTRIHVDKVDMDTILLNQYLQFDYKYVRNLYKRNKDFFAIYRDLIKYIKEREYKFKRFSEYDKSKINKKSIPVAWSMVNHLSYVEAFFCMLREWKHQIRK